MSKNQTPNWTVIAVIVFVVVSTIIGSLVQKPEPKKEQRINYTDAHKAFKAEGFTDSEADAMAGAARAYQGAKDAWEQDHQKNPPVVKPYDGKLTYGDAYDWCIKRGMNHEKATRTAQDMIDSQK